MDRAGLTGPGGGAVWVTRALPGARGTARALAELGFAPTVEPLVETRPLRVAPPDLGGVAALAFTSATAVRAFAALHEDRTLPVFAVGDATAEVARAAGWARVRSAAGDVGALDALLGAEAPDSLVLAPGARRPAGELRRARRLAIYETTPAAGPWPRAAAALAQDRLQAVLLHSPSAAHALAASGLGSRAAEVLALSAACAAPLAAGLWGAVRIAERPEETALLALLPTPSGSGRLGARRPGRYEARSPKGPP